MTDEKSDATTLRTESTETFATSQVEANEPLALENVAKRTLRRIESLVLYAFHEAPEYQRDNQYILTGYRGQLDSFKRCFHSIWYVHNETGRPPNSFASTD
jgi:hypothetical protein